MIRVKGQGVVTIEPNDEVCTNTPVHIVVRHNHKKTAMLLAKTYIMKLSVGTLKKGDIIAFEGVLDEIEINAPIIVLDHVRMVKRKYVSKV